MTFLSPFALLWLGSVPVLLWLWRLAATHRRIRVPSLIPFEHLLRRQPRRRSQLVVNLLFWLQLAALIGLALALARPVLIGKRARTILAILDTSASMDARGRGAVSAFDRARRALRSRIRRKGPTDQVLIVTTAPVGAATPEPTSDGAALLRVLEAQRVRHLGGSVGTAARIGRALLGTAPDETIILTDEPRPEADPGDGVTWVSVGAPLANAALVGVDAQGPLCGPSDARVIATVQNFSDRRSTVRIEASQSAERLAEASVELAPRERRSVSLALPDTADGSVEVALRPREDSLAADNQAWVTLRRAQALPMLVQAAAPALAETLSRWLSACPALTWTRDPASARGMRVLITDDAGGPPSDAPTLVISRADAARPVVSHWLVRPDHPIGAYLSPLEAVAASLEVLPDGPPGVAVVSALAQGRKVPIVVAAEREGRRMVFMRLDPSGSSDATPVVVAFFNSLRWLLGAAEGAMTGAPLIVGGFSPGAVRVDRPDGLSDTVATTETVVRYDAATVAGRYAFSQGSITADVAVNFLDPVESDLMDRRSSWHADPGWVPATELPRPVRHPLAHPLMLLLLGLLLAEWWRYGSRERPIRLWQRARPELPAQSSQRTGVSFGALMSRRGPGASGGREVPSAVVELRRGAVER